jgi:hypothetical protein
MSKPLKLIERLMRILRHEAILKLTPPRLRDREEA